VVLLPVLFEGVAKVGVFFVLFLFFYGKRGGFSRFFRPSAEG